MELMPGYKHSDVGVIPEDWNPEYIENFAVITTGSKNTQDRIEDGQYPFFVRSQTVERINSYSFDGEAVLTAGDGVGTGKVFHYINGKFDVHQRVYRISNFAEYVNGYFFYLYFSTHFYNRIMQMTAKSSVDSVRRDMISRMQIALPPTETEQRAIAQALSDVDALLATLDQVIIKKRDLKQAAMQQLLTGKTRLPGFFGEWDQTTFSDVVRHHAGNSSLIKGKLASTEAAGLFPAYSASGQDVWCKHYEYEGDAVVVSAVGSRCGKAFATSGKWCAIANTHVVWPDGSKVDKKFLGYYIDDEAFWMKSGTGQPFVLFKQSFARPLSLPPLPEQAAIASVLSDIDAELLALECHLEKNRNIKQAMMQELLTGKTRLV